MRLEAVSFVVVDTETTGSRDEDRIIEVGAVRVQGGQIVDRFAQLINPGRSVPSFITRLTGITTAMLVGQPGAARVLPAFLEFLGDGVLVAHNLAFDKKMLTAELRRLGLPWPGNPTLCTLRLARRLLPGLPAKGLDGLIRFFQITVTHRHRALADAEATAQVLLRLLEEARRQYGIETLEALLRFQQQRYPRCKKASPLIRLRETLLPRLPEAPGVYLFRDERGRLLYVGKARNLQARVRQYLTAVEAHPPRLRQLVQEIRQIEWHCTATELEALLEESRLIKRYQPRYNRLQRRYRARPFLRLALQEDPPVLSLTSVLLDDGAEYYGPLAGRRQGRQMLEALQEMFNVPRHNAHLTLAGPCPLAESSACGDACASQETHVAACVRRLLRGQSRQPLMQLEARMEAAARRLAFETAARYRDQIQMVTRLLEKPLLADTSVLECDAVLLVREAPERLACCIVQAGHPIAVQALPFPADHKVIEDAAVWIRQHLPERRPVVYHHAEAEAMQLLMHWMHRHRHRLWIMRRAPDESTDAFYRRVCRGLHRLARNPQNSDNQGASPSGA
ncbi:DEDD exonuclease domain-containing protein [Rhodothermus profundi]|uniref:DNA polymerase-3 subunit epsilon n=1 Tax=Rhodothermus profundi TaxID=633813 RepID=A0A1M6Q0A9_9BACT|nr:DEDD exonuclease domain-containing protein [Rhodothermus profundi]SHK13546.1 DNA polymerase-3 subunit epsilon [Rhodothermus profundi]